jgi:hypothetical protein
MHGVPAGAPEPDELDELDEALVDDEEDDEPVDDAVDDDDELLVEPPVDELVDALLEELVLSVEVVVVPPALPPLPATPPSLHVPSRRQSEAVSAHPTAWFAAAPTRSVAGTKTQWSLLTRPLSPALLA